jgi:hypothetical protein
MRIDVIDWTGVEDPHNPGMDFQTAWAIQREIGERSPPHHPKCSAVAGWHPLSGGLLCDCGAVRAEWLRRQDVEREP